jgi:hypothetical protein
MSYLQIITDSRLVALWRVWPNTLKVWREAGHISCDGCNGDSDHEHWYLHETIDDIHQRNANVPEEIPTVAKLLEFEARMEEPALLTALEATERIGTTRANLLAETQKGALPAVKPHRSHSGARWLYPTTRLAQYAVKSERNDVDLDYAARVLGVGRTGVSLLLLDEDCLLVLVEKRLHRGRKFITKASLLAYIDSKIVKPLTGTNITAEEWWEMRVQHNFEELLTKQQIKRRFHVHDRTVTACIENGTFPCMLTQGGLARIPVHVVQEWNIPRVPMPAHTLAKLFGVSIGEAELLVAAPTFCKREHRKRVRAQCPTPLCVKTYIQAHLVSKAVTADEWIAAALYHGAPVTTYYPHARYPGLDKSRDKVLRAIKNRKVRGLELPDGKRVAVLEGEPSRVRSHPSPK